MPRSTRSRRGRAATVTVVDASADGEDPITVLNAVSVGTYPAFLEKREQSRAPRQVARRRWSPPRGSCARPSRSTIVREGRRASVWSVFVGVGRNDPGPRRHRCSARRRTTACSTSASTTRGARSVARDGVARVRPAHRRGAARARPDAAAMPTSSASCCPEFTVAVRPRAGRPSVFVHDGELEERDPAGFTLRCVAVPSALRVYAPGPTLRRSTRARRRRPLGRATP